MNAMFAECIHKFMKGVCNNQYTSSTKQWVSWFSSQRLDKYDPKAMIIIFPFPFSLQFTI